MSGRRSRRLLVLVPTSVEASLLAAEIDPQRVALVCCGVGLAEAGAAASRAIADFEPRAVLLAGIAGALAPRKAPIGAAIVATRVGCDGIGAETGRRFVSFAEPALELVAPAWLRGAKVVRGEIVSVAAAAGSAAIVRARRARHPRALAEEMEGYAVALAARLAEVPLTIVRGISNHAGDRKTQRWAWEPAMAACRNLARRFIDELAP